MMRETKERSLPLVDETRFSYSELVKYQADLNPSLNNLQLFLGSNSSHEHTCRMYVLDFNNNSEPIRRQIRDSNELQNELLDRMIGQQYQKNEPGNQSSQGTEILTGPSGLRGRIIFIEDLTPIVVEMLGSSLDIDPLFFASHIHAPWVSVLEQDTNISTLPSRLRPGKFVNIHHQRTFQFGEEKLSHQKFIRAMNVPRKVTLLQSVRNLQIGLSQSCISIYKATRPAGNWLGIILVDPPVTRMCRSFDGRIDPEVIHVSPELFGGGFEDYSQPPSLSSFNTGNLGPRREALLDTIIYYLERCNPDQSLFHDPSLLRISEHALRIVASEWMIYYQVMRYSIKQYEYSPDKNQKLLVELEKLNNDLRGLQRWRRRVLSSGHKLDAVARFLAFHRKTAKEPDLSSSLSDDYDHVALNIDRCGRLLESMLPVVTYFVQIVDSRRSVAETANITRLTILALVFVPLTFVSSLFSMNDGFGPNGPDFWEYFAVAIPITLVVVVFAQSPHVVLQRIRWRARIRSKGSAIDENHV